MKDFRLEGWLVPTTDDIHYTKQEYDSDYNGTDVYHEVSESVSVIGLELENETIILAKKLEGILKDAEYSCKKDEELCATIRYHISEKNLTFEELNDNILKILDGDIEADYIHHCSDLTGYLWTDEKFIINDHDIMNDIKGYVNFYGVHKKMWFSIEIKFYNVKRNQ
jgi:hypothetical protein